MASTLVLVAFGAKPIQIDSIGRLHAVRRRRLRDERRRWRGDSARKAHFSTTGVRYILRAATVTAHARGRLASTFEAAPVPAARPPPYRRPRQGPTVAAVDLAAVMRRAEKEHAPARGNHALNESNRVHAATATAGNWIPKARPCELFRTSHSRRDDGLGGTSLRALLFGAVRAIVDRPHADGQLPGALRFLRSHALADTVSTAASASSRSSSTTTT